jgi:uncharacterized protein DUF6325
MSALATSFGNGDVFLWMLEFFLFVILFYLLVRRHGMASTAAAQNALVQQQLDEGIRAAARHAGHAPGQITQASTLLNAGAIDCRSSAVSRLPRWRPEQRPQLNQARASRPATPSPRTGGRTKMTNTPLDTLGPVDYIVVEFPAGESYFTGEMMTELMALVDAGTIRVVDVLILAKDDNGSIEARELSDTADLGALRELEDELAELLAEEDVAHLAAAMDPGSIAGVLIWENLWAAPFASAARNSGGQLIANGRIPIQAIIASIQADEDLITQGA